MMKPTLTTVPVCIDFSDSVAVGEALVRLQRELYDGVRFEALALQAMAKHFGSLRRESVLDCSDADVQDGSVLKGRMVLNYACEFQRERRSMDESPCCCICG